VLIVYTTSARRAAAALASSPSGWTSRCRAVGATSTGIERVWPSTVVANRGSPPPVMTRGSSRQRSKAARFPRSVASSPEPPAM